MKKIKLLSVCFFIFCLYCPVFSQTITYNITEFDGWDFPYPDVKGTTVIWNINVPATSPIFVEMYVDIQEGYDMAYVYSIADDGRAVQQGSFIGSESGFVQSLYSNGKMRVVLYTYDIGEDDYYFGVSMGVYSGRKLSYYYDGMGNRTGRQIEFEYGPALRSAMLEEEPVEEIVYEEQVEYATLDGLQQADVLIYPNPTEGQLAVEIRNMAEESDGEIYLLRGNGQMIEKKTIASERKIDFDLSGEVPGIYLLNIRIGKTVTSWKVIKK